MGKQWLKIKLQNKFLIPTVVLMLIGMGVYPSNWMKLSENSKFHERLKT